MAHYSEEFKESIIQKMMPPKNVPVSQLARDTGISDATLSTWRKTQKRKGYVDTMSENLSKGEHHAAGL